MTRIFEPDWPALYSAGPARIPLEHGAYAHLSRSFLDFFVGGSGYETIQYPLFLESAYTQSLGYSIIQWGIQLILGE